MSTDKKPVAESSGDGMASYSSPASGSSAQDTYDSSNLAAEYSDISRLNGFATLVSSKFFTETMAKIYLLFGATRPQDKVRVEHTLIYFFSVHGTSPQTLWGTYEQPMVCLSKEVRANEVVKLIGANRLKKFMGRFTKETIAMFQASTEVQGALSERAARRGLANGQEVFAVDYIGKDGSLSQAEAQVRVMARDAGLHYRANNTHSIMEQQRAQMIDTTPSDARALGNTRNVMEFNS